MKIVVLGGGISSERHVALVSATSVCKALRSLGHKAIFVDMFLGLENYAGSLDDIFEVEDGFCGDVAIEHTAPDIRKVIESRKFKSPSHLGQGVLEACQRADCVFLGLHGADGEDGRIQATLDLLGVPYTGSGPLGSAMAMDKPTAKKIMKVAGIPTPDGKEFDLAGEVTLDDILHSVTLPCVVKLVDGGSSIGVEFCSTEEELEDSYARFAAKKAKVLIEERIFGREFTVPVLDGRALSPIEIVPPEGGSFDYVAKYQSGSEGASEICPADVTPAEDRLLRSTALKFHNALGLSVYSRTDFILDGDGNIWCLECNTLPGMTPNSLIPKAAALEGLDYPHLCEKIVMLSLEARC